MPVYDDESWMTNYTTTDAIMMPEPMPHRALACSTSLVYQSLTRHPIGIRAGASRWDAGSCVGPSA